MSNVYETTTAAPCACDHRCDCVKTDVESFEHVIRSDWTHASSRILAHALADGAVDLTDAPAIAPIDLFAGVLGLSAPAIELTERHFEIVGRPGERVRHVRPGDLLLRAGLGEGWAHVAVIAAPELIERDELEAVGVTAECRLPGVYVRVIEGELAPHREADCFARRLSGPDHRLPPDQAVIRQRRTRRPAGRPDVAISPDAEGGLPTAETIVHSCAPGEGPPAPIPDPEGKSPHPLVYRGVTPLRSRNPAVGYAQHLLNFFLAEMRAGTHDCPGANATMRAYMARNLAALEANGQLPLVVDCRFGPNTELATKIFQTCRGILVDGKIGPVTWPLLKQFERVVPQPPQPAPRPTPAPTPAPVPCPPATCTPVAPFLPSRVAFRFVNSFSVAIPLPGRLPTLSGGFGLCGGMATAAQDHFLTCVPRPSATTPPVHGDPLFAYLLSRQLDSLGSPTFGPVLKFVEWTNRPDTSTTALGRTIVDGVQELTVPEFRAVVRRLRAGELVVLGLVYVGPRSVRIHENHQVLAYKQTTVSATETDLHVYDPNAPLNDHVTIRCTMAARGRRVQCEQRFGASGGTRNVRGFFQMPYSPQTPPCLP